MVSIALISNGCKHAYCIEAGTDTTASVLNWFVLYMILHPEIQEECYQAIKEVSAENS